MGCVEGRAFVAAGRGQVRRGAGLRELEPLRGQPAVLVGRSRRLGRAGMCVCRAKAKPARPVAGARTETGPQSAWGLCPGRWVLERQVCCCGIAGFRGHGQSVGVRGKGVGSGQDLWSAWGGRCVWTAFDCEGFIIKGGFRSGHFALDREAIPEAVRLSARGRAASVFDLSYNIGVLSCVDCGLPGYEEDFFRVAGWRWSQRSGKV
jgi:hypothetical protein